MTRTEPAAASAAAPARDCPICPRLVAFREELRAAEPDWHNAPVPSFGPLSARLFVVGLAPGMKGANRTGRPFTGDYAGDLLYATLAAHGFAAGDYDRRPDDGLDLVDCRIANAVRCLPPQNKPTPAEQRACNGFLAAEIQAMPNLEVVLALGRVSPDAVLRALGRRPAAARFAHGAVHDIGVVAVADSYHCSRYNTNTGRLTVEMFDAVVAGIRRRLATP
ncbi:MAG: uracil-DNA glycosylase [Alphaproteobacteria bacterium]